jgi:hypothetical protein
VYIGRFLGLGVILVIFRFWGIMIIFVHFGGIMSILVIFGVSRIFWSFFCAYWSFFGF